MGQIIFIFGFSPADLHRGHAGSPPKPTDLSPPPFERGGQVGLLIVNTHLGRIIPFLHRQVIELAQGVYQKKRRTEFTAKAA